MNLKDYLSNADSDNSEAEQFCLDEDFNKWTFTKALQYFINLRLKLYPDSVHFKKQSNREYFSFRYMYNTTDNNELFKLFLDNTLFNWNGVKEKYKQTEEFPTVNIVKYLFSELTRDIKEEGYTLSRSHRINEIPEKEEKIEPW